MKKGLTKAPKYDIIYTQSRGEAKVGKPAPTERNQKKF